MKKENGKWLFESHEEIRAFLAQKMPENVYLSGNHNLYVQHDLVMSSGSGKVVGSIFDHPACEFSVDHNYLRYEIHGDDVLSAFYAAGEHLAARLRTAKGERRETMTARELTVSELKGGPMLVWPVQEQPGLYTVTTGSACYNVPEERLFWAVDHMEKVEGVSTAKRRRFTVRSADGGKRDVVARFSFSSDKVIPKMKKCYDGKDTLRLIMGQPAVELRTGIIVASNGHILAAHRLKDYDADFGEVPYDVVSVPREVVSMKGTVSVVAENTRDGLVVTATDATGRSATHTQNGRYPNWRSVFPQRVCIGIDIDPDAWLDGVKRILPYTNSYSHLMRMDAKRGDDSVTFYAEDFDFSKTTTATVPAHGGVACGLFIGVKATLMADLLAFRPTVMHWRDPSSAMLFLGDEVVIICMPMLIDDVPVNNVGLHMDSEMTTFSIDKWVDDACKAAGQEAKPAPRKPAPKKVAVVAKAAAVDVKTPEPETTIEDRLRAALRRQLAMAA